MSRHTSRAVAKYLLDSAKSAGKQLTPMQLLKLVYIAHGWMLGLYSRPLLKEQVEAWEYGPVIRDLYQAVKKYRSSPVEDITAPEEGFDQVEANLLDQVLELYGDKSGPFLSALTHAEGTPWYYTWNSDGKNGVISNDIIESHYSALYREATEQTGEAGREEKAFA